MPTYDLVCTNEDCAKQFIDVVHSIKSNHPACTVCGSSTHTMWSKGAGVIPDDIPGGILIRHGLCDPETGEPRKYYSHSEIRAEAKRRGMENIVRHVGEQGTDKCRHTTRWY